MDSLTLLVMVGLAEQMHAAMYKYVDSSVGLQSERTRRLNAWVAMLVVMGATGDG